MSGALSVTSVSFSSALATTLFLTVPTPLVRTTKVKVSEPPLPARALIVQTLPFKTEPVGTTHSDSTISAGPAKTSVTLTLEASVLPLLVTVIV